MMFYHTGHGNVYFYSFVFLFYFKKNSKKQFARKDKKRLALSCRSLGVVTNQILVVRIVVVTCHKDSQVALTAFTII